MIDLKANLKQTFQTMNMVLIIKMFNVTNALN